MELTHEPASLEDEMQLFDELVSHLVDLASVDGARERAAIDAAEMLCSLAAQLIERTTNPPADDPAREEREDAVILDSGALDGVLSTIRDGVPTGGVALVITKGDDRLLDVAARTCLHFPSQADGRWAGFHPRDDHEALSFLTRAQQSGATHFVVPAFSLWWLQHYTALRAHLDRHGKLVLASQHALVYQLPRTTVHHVAELGADELRAQQLRTLVDAVLPGRCTVLVAADGSAPLDLGDRRVIRFPMSTTAPNAVATPADVFAALQRARRSGARYLVIATDGPLSARAFDEFRRSVRASFSLIVDRPSTAAVFQLVREHSHRGAQ